MTRRPVGTIRLPYVGPMLGQRLKRSASIGPT